MAKKNYLLMMACSVTIQLDDAVIATVDDEWRKVIYAHIKTPEQIAEHLGYNLVINDAKLSQLDGFADQPDTNASIVDHPKWEVHCMNIYDA
jgi:hypothetical protein